MTTLRSELALAGAPPVRRPAVRVELLGPGLGTTWDSMVRSSEGGSFFHLMGWKRVIERRFGHPSHYLVARRGTELAGLVPLVHMRSLLFGRSLVSVPYGLAGGVLARDVEAKRALLAHARQLARELQVDYLELRSEHAEFPELQTKNLYVTFRTDLREPEEALLRRMERKRRGMMNYVARADYTGEMAGEEVLPLFYRLFCATMRHHGTPVYPRSFLREIVRQHPGEVTFWVVRQAGVIVGITMVLLFEGVVMPFYAGSTQGPGRPRGLDDYTYLQLMRWGRENDFHTFDFGRSKLGTGAHWFKARWGMEEVPLHYQYDLVRSRELPNVSPANPRYARAVRIWQRLPLWVTRLVGPSIVRRIP